MTPQELKNSILQLAIQGKLVPQIAEEGTAEELYQQIQTEKQKLIKEGKLKKEKPLPPISEDEIPFEIPESWKWVRMSAVIDVRDGTHDTPKYVLNGIPLVTSKNLVDGKINFETAKNISFEDARMINMRSCVDDGDILFAMIGTIGNPVLVKKDREFSIKNMALFKKIDASLLYMDYVLFFLQNAQNEMKAIANASVQSFVSLTVLRNYLFPLPPLAEQKRIVAKIEELFREVDRYGESWEKLQKLNEKFPEDMKKSLLQYAIQGKLVEQRPEEGTGEELYQQIQAEKQALIKEGKIKKEKPLPEITEDEIPFEIPESWKWVRLDDLVRKEIKRGKSPMYIPKSGTLVFAQKCNTKAGYIDLSLALCLDETKLNKYSESEFMQDMDIVLNSTGNGTLGRIGIYRDSDNPNKLPVVPDSHVTVIRVCEAVCVKYVFYGLKYYQPYMEKLGSGSTNQTELSASTVKALLFPLPPLAEQKRIVAKLEELLELSGKLKKWKKILQ